jgi:hypothetical protein
VSVVQLQYTLFKLQPKTSRKRNKTVKSNTNKENSLADFADVALAIYQKTMQSGRTLQEETWQSWTRVINQSAVSQLWQKGLNKATGIRNNLAPLAQERLDELVAVLENTSSTGCDLMKQALEVTQAVGIADSQAKWVDFCASSLTAARNYTAAVAKVSSNAVDAWFGFVQKSSRDFLTGKAPDP